VCLTPEADAALEAIRRVTRDVRACARGDISEEEWELLNRLLKKARANLAGLCEKKRSQPPKTDSDTEGRPA